MADETFSPRIHLSYCSFKSARNSVAESLGFNLFKLGLIVALYGSYLVPLSWGII